MELLNIAAFLRVLGDETRLRLVHALWRVQPRAFSVSDLVEVLALPQPTVSRHLAVLREAGVVRRKSTGTFRYYQLADTQARLHAAVLGALEAFVPASPEAQADAQRLDRIEKSTPGPLTGSNESVTSWLPEGDDAMDHLFKALGHPIRRRILDAVGREPGRTIASVASLFEESRVAVSKHIATLERAGLLHSRRHGRERRLYADPMPVQLIYDRWTDRLTAPLATRVAQIKYAAEERRES